MKWGTFKVWVLFDSSRRIYQSSVQIIVQDFQGVTEVGQLEGGGGVGTVMLSYLPTKTKYVGLSRQAYKS